MLQPRFLHASRMMPHLDMFEQLVLSEQLQRLRQTIVSVNGGSHCEGMVFLHSEQTWSSVSPLLNTGFCSFNVHETHTYRRSRLSLCRHRQCATVNETHWLPIPHFNGCSGGGKCLVGRRHCFTKENIAIRLNTLRNQSIPARI